MKKQLSVLLAVLMAGALLCSFSCGNTGSSADGQGPDGSGDSETAASGTDSSGGENGGNIMVQIEMENGGIIKLELYPDIAPITVENFVNLVNEGFYDGLTFHRVINGFMIQGGDPEGTGMGGSGKTIKGEFALNGVQNDLSHVRGVISMARRSKPLDSASSQFFIVQKDSPHLDGSYAAFGRVTEGMDVVDEIASVATDYNARPYEDVVIKSIRVIE